MDLILTFEGLTNENMSTLETAMTEIDQLTYEKSSSSGFQGSDELLYFISIAAGTVTIIQGLASLIAKLLSKNKNVKIIEIRDDQDGKIATELLYLIAYYVHELTNEHRQISEIETGKFSKSE